MTVTKEFYNVDGDGDVSVVNVINVDLYDTYTYTESNRMEIESIDLYSVLVYEKVFHTEFHSTALFRWRVSPKSLSTFSISTSQNLNIYISTLRDKVKS